MELIDLQKWILSPAGWKDEINQLSKQVALLDFPGLGNGGDAIDHDWQKLLMAASILTKSEDREHLEAALTIAQAGFMISGRDNVSNSSLLILSQLSNQRTITEAIDRGYVREGYEGRLGISARVSCFAEGMNSKIFSTTSSPIIANKFQLEFWNATESTNWLYALAPTASGKSFIVLKYLLERLGAGTAHLVIYIAPTRALVSEVEQKIRTLSNELNLNHIAVSSIPIKELYDHRVPTALVFTQERLHIFLNTLNNNVKPDILVIDEAQKLNDGMRGVILQDAIDRVTRNNNKTQVIFLSPNAENPQDLFNDAPESVVTKVVERDQPMVNQNLLYASQTTSPLHWKLELRNGEIFMKIGEFQIDDRPTTIAKKLAFIATKLGGNSGGILVYANGPSEAESIAEFIAEIMGDINIEELRALSDLIRDGVHKDYRLVKTLLKGVAFHYGNMPSLIREEIEDAFNKGLIKYLVCTSTLIEGVNLSCKTIFVRAPRKGLGNPMQPQDFWNLAGRAGRWGKEFQGNIVCIDPDAWESPPPVRAKFKFSKQTEVVLRAPDKLLNYIEGRSFDSKTISEAGSLESVLGYIYTAYKKEGSLKGTNWAKNFSTEYLETLDSAIAKFDQNIDIPIQVIEKHSGISAVSMQTLLNYFRQRYKGKQDINILIPTTPEADKSYAKMARLLNRINLKLSPSFGFGSQYQRYSVLILNWMQGHTLKRLIEEAIRYDRFLVEQKKKKNPKTISAIIRDTMQEVEEIARFKAPKYISCYTDVLKIFLEEEGKMDQYPEDYPFDLFLEFGVMTQTLLSLIGLGLSRMSATEIGNKILRSDLTPEQCMTWLKENISDRDLPNFVKREVMKKVLQNVY